MKQILFTLAILALSATSWATDNPEVTPTADPPEVAMDAPAAAPEAPLFDDDALATPVEMANPPCSQIHGRQCTSGTVWCYWDAPGSYDYCVCSGTWYCSGGPLEP